jgi:hypothetical protein
LSSITFAVKSPPRAKLNLILAMSVPIGKFGLLLLSVDVRLLALRWKLRYPAREKQEDRAGTC